MNNLLSVVSVDVLALAYDQDERCLRLAVPERTREPHLGERCLPGVVLARGERLGEGARRALAKFTDAAPRVLGQIHTFDEPNRDPRGPSLSIAMYAVMPRLDPAVSIILEGNTPALGFDHHNIVATSLPMLAEQLWRNVPFTRALLPGEFTTVDARAITRALTGTEPHKGNLVRSIEAIPTVVKRGTVSLGKGRPAIVRAIL